ncbi:zf-TFIIB domain-containing protein [Rhodoferax sp.]|uniref:TFIIB-type zinc ribbon-containing protein n=1 Tax=Rhodoferax sp. TaxID=50421 RepID=UPI001EC31606|nr:zf-TFIIB domain-containing protein [Rhodoferax sp.]MBT9508152.1 zf-TFIIB domain-containing protein [Rhodoferax sp.]
MATSTSTNCPSCRAAMDVHALTSVDGGTVELDLCYQCHGIWLDPQENLKLAPAAVAELFRLLHEHRDATRQPLAVKVNCPRCNSTLTQGFDVVRSGRYITYRCPNRHGRFSAFSSFMIEKGFVRLLTRAEIEDMAQRVAVIHCSGCGAPVDLRHDHACPHCRSAFSLLDPKAVEQALQGYARATTDSARIKAPDLADALVMLERDRQRAQREEQARRGSLFTVQSGAEIDLWALGVAMVWKLLD